MDEFLIYNFKDGVSVKIKDFEKPCEDFYFKINLPDSESSYEDGNGEGVWCYTDAESYKKWEDDCYHIKIFVRILNDSFYYTGLNYGTLIPVELRGEKRPVALYDELIDKYGSCKW